MIGQKLKTIRNQPWDYVTKNDYEEVTLRQQSYLHGSYRSVVDGKDYDIYDPRYTRLRSSNWEAYRDPKKFWYTPFISHRKSLSEAVNNTLEYAGKLQMAKQLDANWLHFIRDLIVPIRHLEYGAAVQLQHVIRYAMGCPIEQSVTYEAFDKQGRAQWLTQLALVISEEDLNFLEASKNSWLEDPAFQPLVQYIEEVLVTEDWAEILVAINLCLDPLILNLIYGELAEVALENRDHTFPVIGLNCLKQLEWQEKWNTTLFTLLAQDPAGSRWDYLQSLDCKDWKGDYRWGFIMSDPRDTPEEKETNAEIISTWIHKWHGKAYEAVAALQPLFDRYGIAVHVEEKLDQLVRRSVETIFTPMGMTLEGKGVNLNV